MNPIKKVFTKDEPNKYNEQKKPITRTTSYQAELA